jgi:hypothetical protein
MVTMLDAGWTLASIAAHFGVDVKEVEQAILKQGSCEKACHDHAWTIQGMLTEIGGNGGCFWSKGAAYCGRLTPSAES